MRLEESLSASVEWSTPLTPVTPVTPIEAEPLYETAAVEPYTADESPAESSVQLDDGGASFADGWFES
jgi:hypothetical protein